MKRFSIVVLFLLLLTTPTTQAGEEYGWRFASTVTDVFVSRPFTFIATLVGGAIWTVALPVTAPTHTSEEAFDALVRQPWNLTVNRALGDHGEN